MRTSIAALVSASFLGGPAMAETDSCVVVLEHVQGETDNPWRTVNDGVMGGLSDGGSVLENGTLTFSGNTNTNGGGFSSLRIPLLPGAMADADRLKVYMKPDARTYSMTLRTNVTSYGRRIAFRAPITGANDANGVTVSSCSIP